MDDKVNHPNHYTQYPVEVIEITKYTSFCLGNIIKYTLRAPFKNRKEDYDKALKYLSWEKGLYSPNNTIPKKSTMCHNCNLLIEYFEDQNNQLMVAFLKNIVSYVSEANHASLFSIENIIQRLKNECC